MYIFQKIDEFALYGDARKTIANFVLDKKGNLGKYTLKEVADLTFTSKATLVRFAQALGFSGWREFIQAFLEEARYYESHYSDIDPNIPFTENDSYENIINKISSLQVESILDTADLMHIPTLKNAVDIILSSNRIVLMGLSPNTLLGETFRRKMLSIGIIISIPRNDEYGIYSSALTPTDCAIIVSYAGNIEKRGALQFIPIMKKNGVKLIGLAGGGNNYMREQIDCLLAISSREKLYSKIAGFATETSIATIFNILFSCCFTNDYKRNWEYKLNNALTLEVDRNTSFLDMREDTH